MDRKKLLQANIWKYYVSRIFSKRIVWPILTIFLIRNSLTTTEIGIVFAVGTILGLILEVPSGAIADKIGRKNSLFIANVGWAASMFIFWISNNFWGFLIANGVYHITGSLHTGTNEAFIFETLKELKREKDLKMVMGKALFISQVTTGILFIAVPFIANFYLKLPFLINTIIFLANAGLILTMLEPKIAESVSKKEIGGKKDFFGFREFASDKVLFLIAITFALIGGINGLLADFRQAYLDFIKIDLSYFGFIYLSLRLLIGFAGNNVYKIEKRIGRVATFWLMPTISLLTYVGLSLMNSLYGLIFITLDGIQEGLSRPIEQDYLNNAIKGSKRATFLSIFNLMSDLIRAVVVYFGAIIMDHHGINSGFIFLSILTIVFVFPCGVMMNKKIKAAAV